MIQESRMGWRAERGNPQAHEMAPLDDGRNDNKSEVAQWT